MKIIDLEKLNNKALKVQYEMFINEVNPFCSVTTTIDVSNLMKYKKKHHLNAMMMFCIQNAGEKTKMCHYQVNNKTSITIFFYSSNLYSIIQELPYHLQILHHLLPQTCEEDPQQ